MLNISQEFKQEVLTALFTARELFTGTDSQFAKQYGINAAVYSRLKNGERPDGLIRDAKYLEIGQRLDVSTQKRKWKAVETDVFLAIREAVLFCQVNSKSLMLVDDAGIGKTYAARILSRTLKNCFYLDASQCKTVAEFVRLFAQTIGIDHQGKISTVKAQIKYVLNNVIPGSVIIVDEAGDLEDRIFKILKEIWNATENKAGWYMMGAEGLQSKVERNINNKKPGFAEIFSRFGEKYGHITPFEKTDRQQFYKKLITDVIAANAPTGTNIDLIVKKCLTNDSGKISGLRRAESLLLIAS